MLLLSVTSLLILCLPVSLPSGRLRLMKAVDCPATIRDFIFPNRTRLRLMLAAIINFVRFAAEREGTYDELSGATIELLEQRQALAEEHRSRAKRAKALRSAMASPPFLPCASSSFQIRRFLLFPLLIAQSLLRAHREAALPQIQELQQQIADLEKEIATAKKHVSPPPALLLLEWVLDL